MLKNTNNGWLLDVGLRMKKKHDKLLHMTKDEGAKVNYNLVIKSRVISDNGASIRYFMLNHLFKDKGCAVNALINLHTYLRI